MKTKDKNKKVTLMIVAIILLILSVNFIPQTKSVTIAPGTYFEVGNENYTVYSVMYFSQIIISSNWITFNTTGFNVTAPNDIDIVLYHMDDDPLTTLTGEYVLNFSADTVSGTVWFNLSGFAIGNTYDILRNGTLIATDTSNATGVIHFSSSSWSERFFSITVNSTNPTVQTLDATDVEETIATLNGYLIDGGGSGSNVWFEWGKTIPYSNNDSAFDLTLVDSVTTGFNRYSIWGNDTNIYTANINNGFSAYTFNDDTLTLVDSQSDGSNYRGVWSDDTYIYATSGSDGLFAYSFDGSSLTLLDSQNDVPFYYFDVWGDGTYIYVAGEGSGIRAYTFNGATFSLLITQDDGGNYNGVWGDGSYVYVASGTSGIRAYTFNGVAFTLLDTQDDGGNYNGVWGDGTYVYAACDTSGIRAYTFDGSNFVLLDTQDDGDDYLNVWGDGSYVYVANDDDGLRAYTFDGSDFVLLETVNVGDECSDVWGDGTYVYAACDDVGVKVYNNFDIVNTGETFSQKLIELDIGQLYRYRAAANNDNGTAYGSDVAFLTRPNSPVSGYAKATGNFSSLNISWTPGDGANNTIIERNTTASWSRGDGTEIYNGTGTYYVDTGLTQSIVYHYRLWSYTEWTYNPTVWKYSSGSGFYLFNTTSVIDPPYNGNSVYYSSSQYINITWTRGNYSDREIVVKNNNTWASNPGDGWVRQNSTNTWFNGTETATGYYTIWSYNATENIYSATGLNILWGALALSCYSENNPNTALTFDILITNSDATESYSATGATNIHYIDMEDIPYGTDTIFQISNSSYETRSVIMDIFQNNFYNLTFYLPLALPGGGSSDPSYDENETYSENYIIHVIGTQTEYGVDPPIEDAEVIIRKYINTTDSYEDVGIYITSADGTFTVPLLPNNLYYFNISADGYYDAIESWKTIEIVFEGDRHQSFRLTPLAGEDVYEPDYDIFWDFIRFNATLHINGSLFVNYVDYDTNTTDAQFYIYEIYNFSTTYISTESTTSNTFSFWVTGLNNSRQHEIRIYLNHTTLGFETTSVFAGPASDAEYTIDEIEEKIENVFGPFRLGYVMVFLVYLPIIVLLVLPGPSHPGFAIIMASLYAGFASSFIVVGSILVIVPFAIAIGVILMAVKGGMLKL